MTQLQDGPEASAMSCAFDGLHRAIAEVAAVVDGGSWRLSSGELLQSVSARDDGQGALRRCARVVGALGRSLLRAALRRGTISAEHAAVAAQSLAELSGSMCAEVVSEAEIFLAEQATLVDPRSLAQLAKHLQHVLDPDGDDDLAERERRQAAFRVLELKDKRDGSTDVRGHLDPELAASLRAALGPLARPRPAGDGERDLRTVGQRNADALADLIRIAASGDGMPVQHGARPTVSVHISRSRR